MITVRLWWFYLTYKGIKKTEVRKRFAKDFKGKIFECVSKTNWKKDLMKIPEEEREFFKQFVGKVGLCFECDKVGNFSKEIFGTYEEPFTYNQDDLLKKSCLTEKELDDYLLGGNGYAIHITKLEIFDKPKEIGEFNKIFCGFGSGLVAVSPLTRAPQSWCYIEVDE